jgi:glycosyltransferase involved in cell wall biosynthesis
VPPVIAFDADVLGRRRTGDETYAANVLAALGALDVPFRVLAYLRDPSLLPLEASAGGVVTPVRVATTSNYVRNALTVPARLRADRPALYHGNYLLPPGLPCRGVVAVHDCGFMRHDGFMPPATQAAFRRFVPWSVRRAARVVTVSEFTRRDLLELMPDVPEHRVIAIPNGVSRHFHPVDGAAAGARARFGLDDGPYALFIGASQPRKNVRRLLEGWRIYRARHPDAPTRLVLAGAPKGGVSEDPAGVARELGVGESVRVLGYVEGTAALRLLISGARCLVFPSLYEGFGLPAVESMACGTPVVASNTTALPEVTAGAAALVDPLSAAAIADGVERLLTDDAEHGRLRRLGLRRAAELTWERTAERLADVYLDVLAEQPRARASTTATVRVTSGEPTVIASIVSTGEADRLRPCIASLETQGLGDRLRVVVVCNRRGDGSAELVRAAFPRALVVEQPTPRGFSENHNAGLAAAPSDFGMVLNPDVVLRPGCLCALLDVMARRARCGVVAPLLIYPDGRPQPSG